MGKVIMLTGSKGQLGNEFRSFASTSRDSEFQFSDIDSLDITNKKAVYAYINHHKPDFIINCAGYTAVDRAEEDADQAMKINAEAVKYLVSAITGSECKFIQISSDYVLNGLKNIPLKEDDNPEPVSVYSKSKYLGELNALTYPNTLIIRTSWLYSSSGHNFVKTILRLSGERESINVVNDQIGTPTYARDLAEVIMEIIRISIERKRFIPGIFHYSNEGFCSWFDFAMEIKNLRKLKLNINPCSTSDYPLPAYRPAYSVLSKDKIKNTFNINIPSWEESLSRCLKEIE